MEVYNESPMATVLLKNEGSPSVIFDSALWVSNSSSFHASASMVNLEDEINRDMPFFSKIESKMETFNDGYDNCYHQLGRKRRLSAEQVHFLEKSFELENKLEPERKIQLAKELCLQPRQVAIWFQNRRARFKTKVLEKEYDKLKASYDQLKADYKNLCKEKEIMENEVDFLTDKLFMRRNKRAKPEPISPTESPSKPPKFSPNAVTYAELASSCKQEDASSSDVLNSENPNNFGPEASDFSQDEDEESLGRSLLTTSVFPKTEDELYDDLQPNSCNLGFPVLNQGTWFWQ